jgi:SAM-dependent methyltransferase
MTGDPKGAGSTGAAGGGDPWFVEAFRADYLQVYPHRDVESARREVAWILDQGITGRVLDLCCGFGRHTLAMRERGVDVFGMDLSMDLLARAQSLPRSELLAGRLLRGDARRLPFADGAFDGLANLFSSFGYFGDDGDREVLDEIARVTKPGATIVLDLMNPPRIRAGLVPASHTEREGIVLDEHRALEEGGRCVVKDVVLTRADGTQRTWRESVRMYETGEMSALLGQRGFTVERSAGDFDGSRLNEAAPRQILVARRPRA